MSEPGFQPLDTAAAGQQSLWARSPGWRNLTMLASFLTLAAVTTPLLLPPPANTVMPAPVASHLTQPTALANASVAHNAVAPAVDTASLPAQSALSANPAASCVLTMSTEAQPMGSGVVIGFEDPQAAQSRLRANESINGAPISPAFASTPRAIVRLDGSAPGAQAQIVVLPPGMMVNRGDHISFNGRHRDPSAACAYIPPLVTADSGPGAPPAAGASQLAAIPPHAAADNSPLPPPLAGESNTATPGIDLGSLPVGTEIVPSGVLTRVNRHNRYTQQMGGDLPLTITIITPPAHGTVTTQPGTAPLTFPNAGVTRVASVTNVFYQSAPGYIGQDTFTYKRTSPDPNDPLNARTFTVTVYAKK